VGHPQVTKIYNEEKIYSLRSLVVVHIVNFQRDFVVIRFIRVERIICSTSKGDRAKVQLHLSQYLTSLMHKFVSQYVLFHTASGIITPIGVMIPEAV